MSPRMLPPKTVVVRSLLKCSPNKVGLNSRAGKSALGIIAALVIVGGLAVVSIPGLREPVVGMFSSGKVDLS